MDPEKVAFLFGELPDWADPDDPDERAELLSATIDVDQPGAAVQAAARSAVANQIADDDPPQVWDTARRLLAAGLDRDAVMSQLVLAFTPAVMAALAEEEPFDLGDYLSALERLPLPSPQDVERVLVEVARTRRSTAVRDLDELVAARLGVCVDDRAVELLLDRVAQHVIDQHGPLEMLAGDQVVHVEAVTDDIVLTHRLSETERDSGVLPLGVDLAGFRRRATLTLADGAPVTVTADGWVGPAGWLADVPANGVVAVRVRGNVVSCTSLEEAPAVDAGLVALIRAGYDHAVDEPWLPVPVEELVLHAVLTEPAAFATPTAPLSQLLDAAGLEVRGTEVAHEESVWQSVERVQRMYRLLERLGPGDLLHAVVQALGVIEDGPLDTTTARHVLDDLYDPATLEVVTGELLGADEDPERLRETGALARQLLAAASRPAHRAVAHWLSAVVAERQGHVTAAETHLRAAVRDDPGWPCAADRLAWYCSDRGDVDAALTLWRGLGATAAVSADVRLLEAFSAPAGHAPGRNDRCWCGSGRKFKQCHLGRTALPPLPDRVGWICRKATAYLERRGGAAAGVVYDHAFARSVDPDDEDAVGEALGDPLVIDVVLHEGGWFDRFLAERGALLPEDESLLATAWTLVDRTVYELLDVRAGVAVQVRDLRTGEVFDVRERTFSATAQQGSLVCARAVPDGQSHQFVGGLFPVAPGRERALLDLLDERDGLALLAYVAELHRPPVLVGPDGRVIDLDDLRPDDLRFENLPPEASPALSAGSPQEVMLGFLEDQEQRWCEQQVPALGGITPVQAAADPTRREELVRLIASFPSIDPSADVVALRPDRLRALLGLRSAP